jgi:glycerate dehydrogenase
MPGRLSGYNNIDVEAARRQGIVVCNVPSYSTDAVAQLVVTFMLNLSCSLVPLQRQLAAGDAVGWRCLGTLPHFELAGKTLGLIGGRGTIGSRVADIARVLGMKVLISSRSTAPDDSMRQDVDIVDMETLLCKSDFVSIHCPLSTSTRHLIGSEQLKMMKPSAYLINTARGAIIDEAALIKALHAGTIAGAGLDVQEVEPLPVQSPLIGMPNVILTPHIGWQRIESRQRLMDTVASNIKAFLAGSPMNVVN